MRGKAAFWPHVPEISSRAARKKMAGSAVGPDYSAVGVKLLPPPKAFIPGRRKSAPPTGRSDPVAQTPVPSISCKLLTLHVTSQLCCEPCLTSIYRTRKEEQELH
jgi:hypothetical protein